MAKQQGIRNQITKYQTAKKLIEFMDNLVVADVDNYAKIHSTGGEGTFPSRIKITMLDYTNGTGDKKVEVGYNLVPSEFKYLYKIVSDCPKDFSYKLEKINEHKVEGGFSPVTKISLNRQEEYNGQKKNYPWTIRIENGRGIAEKTDIGGTKIKAGSYTKEKEVFINLNDMDMFKQFCAVMDYITYWEMAYGIPLIKRGKEKLNSLYTTKS